MSLAFTNVALHDIICKSEKRREVLLFLYAGPRYWKEIRGALKYPSTSLIPQIRILEREGLVARDKDLYSLTPAGMVIVEKYASFTEIVDFFHDDRRAYWNSHEMFVLPEELRTATAALTSYELLTFQDIQLFHTRPFLDNLVTVTRFSGMSYLFHPTYPQAMATMAQQGIPTILVFSKSLIDFLCLSSPEIIQDFIDCPSCELYQTKEDVRIGLIVTNHVLSITFPHLSTRELDFTSNMVHRNPTAIDWGFRVVDYYRRQATLVTCTDRCASAGN